jgi:hypothetical protein
VTPSIRLATLHDAAAILACLAESFAEYRDRYTTPAYLDTVLTLQSLRERFQSMRIFVAVGAEDENIATIACSVTMPGEGNLRGKGRPPSVAAVRSDKYRSRGFFDIYPILPCGQACANQLIISLTISPRTSVNRSFRPRYR